MEMDKSPTKLDYYDDMWNLHSTATLVSHFKGDDGRHVLILDRTIFYPQGGGQPADTGFLIIHDSNIKFVVHDVRSKDGIVLHYGVFEGMGGEFEGTLEKGKEVSLSVDEDRRKLNFRLHSAGHLLDICLPKIGLGHLEPGKAYHFSDGPWVEYKGVVPQNEMQNKQKELEIEANALISMGGKVSADILLYDEAAKLCGGILPDYVPKESTPRIVQIGDNPGCPCGGTHVLDVSDITKIKVSQIRSKKGMTKVFYNVES
uniref:Alanyl-transfer RNA synthetases family profile domain-containing protein n=1 Tax=Medicago truncatula TaxID=3880 RepID=B7FIM9_MEDTR|nr:unknown [Medicago truncatula]AFK34632.1 unknown [Medicago truncatula]